MDAMRDPQRQKWIIAGLALILGIGLGVFYGWVISPVEWTDATPELLREDLRVDYLRMTIDSYSVNRDAELAVERYQRLGEQAEDTLDAVAEEPGTVDPTAIQNFSAVVEIMDEPGEEGAAETQPAEGEDPGEQEQATAVAGEQPEEEDEAAGSIAVRLILPVCGVTLLLGILLVGVLYLRGRLEGGEDEEPVLEPGFDMDQEYEEPFEEGFPEDFGQAEAYEMEQTAAQQAAAGPEPLATFRTIYSLGDDRYDDSFSIESPAGDFLGECGVGIGDVMGAGEPKKVSAFEVWLFDKNDIQTVTKVLMSEYTYRDEEARNRLAAKGSPLLAEPGGVVYLETASLEVEARIVDMTYGQSALPQESFFERMTIELRAYPKEA